MPVRKNDLGFYAIRTCKNSLENILLLAKNIDLDNDSEIDSYKKQKMTSPDTASLETINRDLAQAEADLEREKT